jgi:predicted DNA-binding protein
MHFNLWFNTKLVQGIEAIMASTGKKRNTVVKEAVEKYLKEWNEASWPESIKEFKGFKDFKEEDRFENFRKDLKEPKENIFEE